MSEASPSAATSGIADPARVARWALIVLTLVNLFNYLDRFVLAALVESLRGALHLTDSQLGLLPTAFVLVYMATSPIFGNLGDKGGRPRLIAFGVGIWSLATAFGGMARGFVSLFVARSAVGVGEAAYGTVSPGLLADFFPVEQRGRVFAAFSAALPIGSAAGYVLGGIVDHYWGWRAAFFIAGIPGLFLAWLAARLPDPPRGVHDAGFVPHAPAASLGLATYRTLLRNTPYVLVVLGYAAYSFALVALAYWMPAFLERESHMSRSQATVLFGAITVGTGFLGTLLGGWLGDKLLGRWHQAYLWLSGVTALLAAPLAFLALWTRDHTVFVVAIIAAELLVFMSTGPINSAVINVVPPEMRATSVALQILAIHLLGDVPSTPLIGWVSDHSSLGRAMLILPFAFAAAGLIWIYAAWRGERAAPAAA